MPACRFRYYLPKGLSAAPDVACRTSFDSVTVDNSKEFQSSLGVNVHAEGEAEDAEKVWGASFSGSAGYKGVVSEISSGKYKLIMSTARCQYYFAKLNYLDLPELSPEVM